MPDLHTTEKGMVFLFPRVYVTRSSDLYYGQSFSFQPIQANDNYITY
jgi:hypothetical protein